MEVALIGLWLICGIAAGAVANSKGRNGGIWFFLGILLGPIALLMVGFMPSVLEASAAAVAGETVVVSGKLTKVTTHRVVGPDFAVALVDLKPVTVDRRDDGSYAIDIVTLSGKFITRLASKNQTHMNAYAEAINRGASPGQTTNLQANQPQVAPSHESLAEAKKLLDAGLITQREYDTKKAEILARL